MRVLFLLDEVFATRERPLIERLEVGLADEGVRVVRAVPDSLREAQAGGFFVQTATFTLAGMPLSRQARVRRLLDQVSGADDRPIDVVHVMGGAAWGFAATAARLAGAPLVLEVWRAGLAGRVRAVRTALGGASPLIALCPDEGTHGELGAAGLGDIARVAPWGVHVTERERPAFSADVATSIFMVGSGRDARAFSACMEGLVRAIPNSSDARVYLDADAARRSRLWPVLRRLNLTDRVSLIDALEARRELVLVGDALLVPEAVGEHRTIVLDAMGAGMAVLAAYDARIAWMLDGVTARLVGATVPAGAPPGPASADAWADAIRDLVLNPEAGRALGRSARVHVQEHRRASAHVAAVMGVYSSLAGATTAGSIGL